MASSAKRSSAGSPVLEPVEAASAPAKASPAKIAGGIVGMVATIWGIVNIFLAFALYPGLFLDSAILIGVLAVVVGVGGAALFFYFLNMAVEGLPRRASLGVMPYAYLIPGLALIALMLIYPAVQTIHFSFANSDSTAYVGFQNYVDILADEDFRISITNNLLWLIIVPAATVALGVIVAVLADKLSQNGEKVSKSIIFLPMAISFVGASAIWNLVYAYDEEGQRQTGLLNAVTVALGGSPQTWLQIDDVRLNSLLMMVILIWLQVGFAMILLSSAIKGVPEDTLEAARIDGANELQIFWQVTVPQIKGTIVTVFITLVILVLKVFDIVYVLTNGRFKSNVIANLFFNELFFAGDAGRAAAIVGVLLVAITPVLIWQVRHFREEELNQ